MEKALLIIVVSLLFSCKEKNKEVNVNLNKNLFIYFKENINKEDSTIHLDSVRIIRLDTLTQSRLLYKKIMSLYDNIDANNVSQRPTPFKKIIKKHYAFIFFQHWGSSSPMLAVV